MEEYLLSKQILSTPIPSAGAKIFTYGLCANALIVIHSVGLLQQLQLRDVNEIEIVDNEQYPDSITVKGALIVLQYGEIISKQNNLYKLTDFGKDVTADMPSFLHWFESYSKLLGKSALIAQGKEKAEPDDFSIEEVAFTGGLVKERFMPIIIKLLKDIKIQGDFCDLWCGTGSTVIDVCKTFQVNGIGFDKSQIMVDVANKNIHWAFQNDKITAQAYYSDVTNFKGIYPNIEVLYTNFITHHLNPDEHCVNVLRSLKTVFPNAKYLLLIDGVTPTNIPASPEIFSPAFDYIHRLQRIETRNKDRLDQIIQDTGYSIEQEIEIDFPNHFLWLLHMQDKS